MEHAKALEDARSDKNRDPMGSEWEELVENGQISVGKPDVFDW